MVFEDIIGNRSVKNKGDGDRTCPVCGSYNIVKEFNNLSTTQYVQECQCMSCWSEWSILYKFRTAKTNNHEIIDIREAK